MKSKLTLLPWNTRNRVVVAKGPSGSPCGSYIIGKLNVSSRFKKPKCFVLIHEMEMQKRLGKFSNFSLYTI